MQPFDYRIAVQDPLQMALAGYQQGQQFQQQRVQAERETQLYDMEMQQYQANQAKLQQEQARAKAMQADFAAFNEALIAGTATIDDVLRINARHPAIAEQVQSAFQMKSDVQKSNEIQRSLRLASLFKNAPEAGALELKNEIAAAEAIGDMERVAALKNIEATIPISPTAPITATLFSLVNLMPEEQFKTVSETLMPKAPEAASSAGKVIADYNAGLFGEVGSPEAIQLREDQLEKAGGGQTINVGSPVESTAFDKALGQGQADQALAISNQGTVARRNRNTLLQLRDTLAASPSGAEAGIKSFAGNFGIDTQGLSDIQAAEALISQLVPTQRAPGSGTMSDADLALYKKSLPRIINQAGGNEKIIRTTLAINDYLIKEAEIADQVINREISPSEGRAKMAALVNPLAPSGGGGTTPGRRKFDAQGREIK